MFLDQETRAHALARWTERFRSAELSQPAADDIAMLEELADLFRTLLASPVERQSAAAPLIAGDRLRELIGPLRIRDFPGGLQAQVAEICDRFSNSLLSRRTMEAFDRALQEALAPVEAAERERAAVAARVEDERLRVAALELLLHALNAFVVTGVDSAGGEKQ